MPPAAITRELIRTSPTLVADLSDFVVEYENDRGCEAVETLPMGLRRMLLFVNWDSEIFNGGFQQYFANRTNDDGAVREYRELGDALQAWGCAAAADCCRRPRPCGWPMSARGDPARADSANTSPGSGNASSLHRKSY